MPNDQEILRSSYATSQQNPVRDDLVHSKAQLEEHGESLAARTNQ